MPSPSTTSPSDLVHRQPSSTSALSSLADSSSRFVIPLSPPPPPHTQLSPPPDSSSPTMLLDYISRLARFEPRLQRYAASKLIEGGPEPVTAFSGLSLAATPARTPSTPARQRDKDDSVRGFSLIDLERVLLNVRPGWWKGRSGSSGRDVSPSRPPIRQTDSGGLDVDLSDVLGRGLGTARSTSPAQSTEQSDPSAAKIPQDTGPGLFLHYYSQESLVGLFSSHGVLSALAELGYNRPHLIFDTSDDIQHRLSVVDTKLFSDELNLGSQDRFVIDVYTKRRKGWNLDQMVCYQLLHRLTTAGSWSALNEMTGEIRAPFVGIEGAMESMQFLEQQTKKWKKGAKRGGGEWEVTEIAWMQMHDPTSKDTRPLLPGQRFPGLGLGRKVAQVMESMASESKVTDGLLNFPFHWHNAAAYSQRGWRHVDPIVEAYVNFLTTQVTPTVTEHGLAFVAWAISLGHLRRITYEANDRTGEWDEISNRLERWSPSEQVFPTSDSMRGFLGCAEWKQLFDKWTAKFAQDGGANESGVSVAKGTEGAKRKAELKVDLEGCPELWKYSKIWSRRDPETGKFR